MELNQKIKLHNRYDIEVKNVKSGEVRQRAQAENIILDGAWGQILHSSVGVDWFDKIAFGTGSGTMSAARTALFTPLSSKTATDSEFVLNNENNYISHRQRIAILENEHNGSQLSEVGIVSETGTLCTHALIKDMNGNPVVITKTDTDIIIIYATVYLLFNTTYSPAATLDILRVDPATNQIASNLLGRRVGELSGWKTAWEHRILLSMGSENAYYDGVAYISDPFYAMLNAAQKTARIYYRVPAAIANIGGFMSAVVGSTRMSNLVASKEYNSLITRFLPGEVAQSPVVEQIGFGDGETTDFATSFAQIPANTVVKVDGIAATPTIYANMPNHNDIRSFFREIDAYHPEYKNVCFNFNKNVSNGTYTIFEKMHSGCLLEQTHTRNTEISVSDDMETWTVLGTTSRYGPETFDVPVAHQQKKYWRFTNGANTDSYLIYNFYQNSATDFKNVKFTTAPESGAVITAEYTPNCAAKDANHVLDIDITIQLAEHVD